MAGKAFSLTTNSGVELFFVLSGVVLLRPYMRKTRPFRPAAYFRRRIQRLWPPYLAALLIAGLVILTVTIRPTWYSRQVLPTFSVEAWVRQLGILNFGWSIYNLAWWSLTPELTFYALAPVCLLLLGSRRLGQWSLLLAVGASALLSVVLWNVRTSMPGVQSSISESSLQFLAYLPCFLTGAMIAKVDLSRRIGIVLVIVGIAYFVFALHVPRANVHAAYALAYGGLVIVAMQPTGIIHRGLSRPLAVWLGERSYSLFLVHFSVLYLADYAASLLLNSRTIAYAVLSRGSGALLSLALAMGIFWLIERKFARNLVSGDEFWPWKLRPIREDHPASLREPLDAHSAIAR